MSKGPGTDVQPPPASRSRLLKPGAQPAEEFEAAPGGTRRVRSAGRGKMLTIRRLLAVAFAATTVLAATAGSAGAHHYDHLLAPEAKSPGRRTEACRAACSSASCAACTITRGRRAVAAL